MKTPDGYAEVIERFGDISKYIRNDGTLSPRWEAERIVRVTLPAPLRYHVGGGEYAKVTRITSHRLVSVPLIRVLSDIHAAGLWGEIDPYGGGFIFRKIRGSSSKVSLHSFGIAWDFRPDKNAQGTDGTMHPQVVKLFEAQGFFWGGNFKGARKDSMHFQAAINC